MSVTGTGSLVPQKSVCEVIQFLADKGVDVDVKNAQGRTAIQIANGLPIDTAVDLMVAILKKEGQGTSGVSRAVERFLNVDRDKCCSRFWRRLSRDTPGRKP